MFKTRLHIEFGYLFKKLASDAGAGGAHLLSLSMAAGLHSLQDTVTFLSHCQLVSYSVGGPILPLPFSSLPLVQSFAAIYP